MICWYYLFQVTISLQAVNEREENLLEHEDIAEEQFEEKPTLTIEAALIELKEARKRISSLEAENIVLRNLVNTLKLGPEHSQDGDTIQEKTPPQVENANNNIDKDNEVDTEANKTRSFVKKLKARKGLRKAKRMSGYVYEGDKKKGKRHEEKKPEEMIDIDNMIQECASENIPLPVITDSTYWVHCPDDCKTKVEDFFKNEFTR